MLSFYSSSSRIVNSKRAITEVIENALYENKSECDLLIIHASIGHNFKELIQEAKLICPNATVVAASCCGVIGKEGVSESMKDIAIMAVKGKDFDLAFCDDFFGKNAYEKTLAMAKDLKAKKPNINMLYYLGSGIDTDNNAVINACEEIFGKDVTLFGATSSDNMKGLVNFQAVNESVYEHAAILIGFSDPTLSVETQATHGFKAIGEPFVVTKAEGHLIHELNGKPAWTEYTTKLGLANSVNCGDTIPIGALGEKLNNEDAKVYGNNHLLRVVTKHDGESLYYSTNINVGTELWLTVRDEDLIFSEMERITNVIKNKIADRQVIAVFHADCLARGKFLFNKIIKEELVNRMQYPFYINGECPPWLGMYGFGEFARLNGKNTYHNYTTGLYVIYRK